MTLHDRLFYITSHLIVSCYILAHLTIPYHILSCLTILHCVALYHVLRHDMILDYIMYCLLDIINSTIHIIGNRLNFQIRQISCLNRFKKSVLYTAKHSVSYIIHPNLYIYIIYIHVCTSPIYIYTSHLHKMLVSSAFMAASVECAMSLHSQWKVGRRLAWINV